MVGTEEITLLGHLRNLENSILEESKKPELLLPFVKEIYAAIENEKYQMALEQMDELEEFMDREFC